MISNASEMAGIAAMASGVVTMVYGFWLVFRWQRLAGGDKVLGATASDFMIGHRRHIYRLMALFLLTFVIMMTGAAIQHFG